jgi:hypothetical protein
MHSIYHENNSKIVLQNILYYRLRIYFEHTLKPNAIILRILSTVNRAVNVVLAYVNISLYVDGLR